MYQYITTNVLQLYQLKTVFILGRKSNDSNRQIKYEQPNPLGLGGRGVYHQTKTRAWRRRFIYMLLVCELY